MSFKERPIEFLIRKKKNVFNHIFKTIFIVLVLEAKFDSRTNIFLMKNAD